MSEYVNFLPLLMLELSAKVTNVVSDNEIPMLIKELNKDYQMDITHHDYGYYTRMVLYAH